MIKTENHGYMQVDYDVDQHSGFNDSRITFSFDINDATQFATISDAVNAVGEYGQRRERLYPRRPLVSLELCRVESDGLRVVETL